MFKKITCFFFGHIFWYYAHEHFNGNILGAMCNRCGLKKLLKNEGISIVKDNDDKGNKI